MDVFDLEDGTLFSLTIGATRDDTVYKKLRHDKDNVYVQVVYRKYSEWKPVMGSHVENCNPYAEAKIRKPKIEIEFV